MNWVTPYQHQVTALDAPVALQEHDAGRPRRGRIGPGFDVGERLTDRAEESGGTHGHSDRSYPDYRWSGANGHRQLLSHRVANSTPAGSDPAEYARIELPQHHSPHMPQPSASLQRRNG